jgi:ribosomal protein S18 acetylase RimI-like enzyme
MSLPTTKPTQSSIRSFFQSPKTPNYVPPPSQAQKSAPPLPQAAAAAPPPPSTNIPPEATIRPVQEQDIPALRRINALLLPVSFSDSFYQNAIDPQTSGPFSRVITWAHDGQEAKIVGSIVGILEPPAQLNTSNHNADAASSARPRPRPPQNLYIRSLTLLSPYRSLGLANAALDHVIATVLSDPNLDVRTVTAHVWTENEEGLQWYQNRGFEKQGSSPIDGYYLKLRPGSAWLVHRPIQATVSSSLPSPTSANTAAAAAAASSVGKQPSPSTTAEIVNLPPISSSSPSGAHAPPAPPPPKAKGQSFQNQRPETEWNDLPVDMMGSSLLGPQGRKVVNGSEPTSSASSRSSSVAGKKKRDRSYPAAAFGN